MWDYYIIYNYKTSANSCQVNIDISSYTKQWHFSNYEHVMLFFQVIYTLIGCNLCLHYPDNPALRFCCCLTCMQTQHAFELSAELWPLDFWCFYSTAQFYMNCIDLQWYVIFYVFFLMPACPDPFSILGLQLTGRAF